MASLLWVFIFLFVLSRSLSLSTSRIKIVWAHFKLDIKLRAIILKSKYCNHKRYSNRQFFCWLTRIKKIYLFLCLNRCLYFHFNLNEIIRNYTEVFIGHLLRMGQAFSVRKRQSLECISCNVAQATIRCIVKSLRAKQSCSSDFIRIKLWWKCKDVVVNSKHTSRRIIVLFRRTFKIFFELCVKMFLVFLFRFVLFSVFLTDSTQLFLSASISKMFFFVSDELTAECVHIHYCLTLETGETKRSKNLWWKNIAALKTLQFQHLVPMTTLPPNGFWWDLFRMCSCARGLACLLRAQTTKKCTSFVSN